MWSDGATNVPDVATAGIGPGSMFHTSAHTTCTCHMKGKKYHKHSGLDRKGLTICTPTNTYTGHLEDIEVLCTERVLKWLHCKHSHDKKYPYLDSSLCPLTLKSSAVFITLCILLAHRCKDVQNLYK